MVTGQKPPDKKPPKLPKQKAPIMK